MKQLYIFPLLLAALALPALVCANTLKQVHIIYRHGDRAPVDPYKSSPNINFTWPNGLSQLTNLGKRQHYALGQFFRQRYRNFFSRDPREVEVKSSDKDRCIASAQVNLAAFFKPEGKFIWNPHLDWQPVPIHTTPKAEDFLINEDAICPVAEEAVKKFPQTPLGRWYTQKYYDLMQYMTKYSGDLVHDPVSIQSVQGVINIEKIHNLIVPEWADRHFSEMTEAASEGFTVLYSSKLIQRLRGGPLVKHILGLMKERASTTTEKITKGYIYSTHDAILAGFMNALGVYNGRLFPYCATILMELHQYPGSHGRIEDSFVRLFYVNNTEHYPFPLRIPNCDFNCPLTRLNDLVQDIIPTDIKKECFAGVMENEQNDSSPDFLKLHTDTSSLEYLRFLPDQIQRVLRYNSIISSDK